MSSFSPSVLGRPLLILPSFLHKTRTSEVDGILWSAQGFHYGFYPGELSDSKQGLRARASNIIKSRAERFHALFSSGTATGLAAAPHSSQEVQQKEFCLPHCVGHVGSPSRLSITNVCLSAALPPLQTSTHFNMYHKMRSHPPHTCCVSCSTSFKCMYVEQAAAQPVDMVDIFFF